MNPKVIILVTLTVCFGIVFVGENQIPLDEHWNDFTEMLGRYKIELAIAIGVGVFLLIVHDINN